MQRLAALAALAAAALALALLALMTTQMRSSPADVLYSDTDYSDVYQDAGGLFPLPLMPAGSASARPAAPARDRHRMRVMLSRDPSETSLGGKQAHRYLDDDSGASARRHQWMRGRGYVKAPATNPHHYVDFPAGSSNAAKAQAQLETDSHQIAQAFPKFFSARHLRKSPAHAHMLAFDDDAAADSSDSEVARLEKEAAEADAADDADAAKDHESEDAMDAEINEEATGIP